MATAGDDGIRNDLLMRRRTFVYHESPAAAAAEQELLSLLKHASHLREEEGKNGQLDRDSRQL